jgi:hypothetical protein
LEDEEGSDADECEKDFGVLIDHGSVLEIGDNLYRRTESGGEEEQTSDSVDP